MRLVIWLAAIAGLGLSSAAPVASASALDDAQVRTVMLRAETLLRAGSNRKPSAAAYSSPNSTKCEFVVTARQLD